MTILSLPYSTTTLSVSTMYIQYTNCKKQTSFVNVTVTSNLRVCRKISSVLVVYIVLLEVVVKSCNVMIMSHELFIWNRRWHCMAWLCMRMSTPAQEQQIVLIHNMVHSVSVIDATYILHLLVGQLCSQENSKKSIIN